MAECPWCHGPVEDIRAPCPNCGKLATDLRATDPPSPIPNQVDVPDLVIPAASKSRLPSRSSLSAVSARPPIAAPTSNALDDDFGFGGGGGSGDLQIDLSAATAKPGLARPPTPGVGFNPFDDDISAGPAIELDTIGGVMPSRDLSPSMGPPVSQRSLAPAPAPPTSGRSLAPTPPPQERPAADPFEASVLADYGQPPDAFWRAPMYAYRVVTRRAELRRELAQKKDDAERTSKRVEDALVAFGERARALAKGGADPLERVRVAEELLASRDGALAGTMDGHKAALAEIDARLGAAETELARTRQIEADASTKRDAAEEDDKRAEAKLKRVEIEIRNGASKSAERDALAADVAQTAGKRATADSILGDARRVVGAAQARLDAIVAERTALDQRFNRAAGTRGAGVDDAQKQLRSALADLGRSMLADGTVTELARAREEVARLEEQAQTHSKNLSLHETAIGAYDSGKVFLGVGLVAVALFMLAMVVFFPFIYRAL